MFLKNKPIKFIVFWKQIFNCFSNELQFVLLGKIVEDLLNWWFVLTGYSSLPRSNHSADSRLESSTGATDVNSPYATDNPIPLETVAEDQEIKQRVGGMFPTSPHSFSTFSCFVFNPLFLRRFIVNSLFSFRVSYFILFFLSL